MGMADSVSASNKETNLIYAELLLYVLYTLQLKEQSFYLRQLVP